MTAPFVDLSGHHAPDGLSDHIASGFVKALRFEAHHRDVNHGFANELCGAAPTAIAPCPPHVELQPAWKAAA